MIKTCSLAVLFLLSCFYTQLHAIELGDSLSMSDVTSEVEHLHPDGGAVEYLPFTGNDWAERTLVVYHIAPRLGVDKHHRIFFDRLDERPLPAGKFQKIVIANMDEATWGTGAFVRSNLEANAVKHPQTFFLLDHEGYFKSNWKLNKNSATLMIVDTQGSVRAVSSGPMTDEEINYFVNLVRELVSQ